MPMKNNFSFISAQTKCQGGHRIRMMYVNYLIFSTMLAQIGNHFWGNHRGRSLEKSLYAYATGMLIYRYDLRLLSGTKHIAIHPCPAKSVSQFPHHFLNSSQDGVEFT